MSETTTAAPQAKNARLRAEVAAGQDTVAMLTAQAATLLARVKDLEGQWATTGRNSSKPHPRRASPSSMRSVSRALGMMARVSLA